MTAVFRARRSRRERPLRAPPGTRSSSKSRPGSSASCRRQPQGRRGRPRALHDEKAAIEARIADLRRVKGRMSQERYENELEELLVELALKNREIRAGGVGGHEASPIPRNPQFQGVRRKDPRRTRPSSGSGRPQQLRQDDGAAGDRTLVPGGTDVVRSQGPGAAEGAYRDGPQPTRRCGRAGAERPRILAQHGRPHRTAERTARNHARSPARQSRKTGDHAFSLFRGRNRVLHAGRGDS